MAERTRGIFRAAGELCDDVLGPGTGARPVSFAADSRRLRKWEAWALVLGVYAAIFFRHAVYSVGVASGTPLAPSSTPDLERIALHATYILIAFFSVHVLLRMGALSSEQVGLGGVWDRERVVLNVRVACFASVAMALGVAFSTVIGAFMDRAEPRYPAQPLDSPLSWAAELFTNAAAGFAEELPLVLVLVWALRSARYSWLVVCVVAAVLRASFHLYYGWEAVGMFVWPVLIVLLYARTGAIRGIIAAHAWSNLFGTPAGYFRDAGDPLGRAVLCGPGGPRHRCCLLRLKGREDRYTARWRGDSGDHPSERRGKPHTGDMTQVVGPLTYGEMN